METNNKLNMDETIHVNDEIYALSITFPLRESVMRSAVKALEASRGSSGLDAGCGIGLQTLILAEEVGDSGHVTGLDFSPDNLRHAKEILKQAGFAGRISFEEGDVRNLPFDDNSFDWAWSSDLVGYTPLEPLPLINELKRVVKSGGIIAILAWSSEMLLPGYPLLEARLRTTVSGLAPFVKGNRPERHFLRALGWFADAGIQNPVVKTLAGGVHAPLSEEDRNALVSLFEMRWPSVESELTPEDLDDFNRLCSPDSLDFIVDHPDYYAFFTYSMFMGRVKK